MATAVATSVAMRTAAAAASMASPPHPHPSPSPPPRFPDPLHLLLPPATHSHGTDAELEPPLATRAQRPAGPIGHPGHPESRPPPRLLTNRWHSEGPCRTQDVPKPQSFMEAPGCSQAAGENASTSEYFTCVSSLSNLPHHDEDGTCRIQQDAPQPQSFMEAPGCRQAAGETASSSEYFTCVSSPSKRPRYDEDGSHQLQQNVPYLGKLNMPVSQSTWKRKIMEWTIGGLTPKMPHLNVISYSIALDPVTFNRMRLSLSHLWRPPAVVRQQEKMHPLLNISPKYPHHPTFLIMLRMVQAWCTGLYKIQQDTPPPESRVEAPGCRQEAGEYVSSSEYFTCVSSPSKLFCYNKDGIKERIVPKDLVQTDSSSDYSYSSNSSHSPSNKEPGLMKIYYMRVQMKRGVAVLCHTGEGWEPPSKKIKMEEMTYTTEVHKNVPLSHMSGENLLNDPEPSVDSPAPEKREKAGCRSEPSTLVAYRRVPLRRALDSGFRCLACCHVFASLEALQLHVEHGVREGFSCHVFHRAMARLKYKKLKRKNKKL
ncbi:hypothetical protein QTO34_014407, partial [Cnephaeus nilssonii]